MKTHEEALEKIREDDGADAIICIKFRKNEIVAIAVGADQNLEAVALDLSDCMVRDFLDQSAGKRLRDYRHPSFKEA